jgi:putative hydrolase of the HAD superfamily
MTSNAAVSFDFWNTLYAYGSEDQRMIRRKQIFKNYVKHYRTIANKDIDKAFNISTHYFIREWKDNTRTPTAPERIELMTQYLELSISEKHITQIAEEFGRLITEIPPKEIAEAKNIVQALSQEVTLGIISDTGYIAGRHIRQFLEQDGMLGCFSSFVFSDEQKYSKPHVSVFEKTDKQLNTELTQLIHIGDLERTDIEGANSAGCRSIKFTGADKHANSTSKAQLVVQTYRELNSGLNQLLMR